MLKPQLSGLKHSFITDWLLQPLVQITIWSLTHAQVLITTGFLCFIQYIGILWGTRGPKHSIKFNKSYHNIRHVNRLEKHVKMRPDTSNNIHYTLRKWQIKNSDLRSAVLIGWSAIGPGRSFWQFESHGCGILAAFSPRFPAIPCVNTIHCTLLPHLGWVCGICRGLIYASVVNHSPKLPSYPGHCWQCNFHGILHIHHTSITHPWSDLATSYF